MSDATATLFAGALSQLMNYQINGCGHSARYTVWILDVLAARPDLDIATRVLCGEMGERLDVASGNRGI